MSSVLMVIPARGGSKSVPRKNLALVGGRPLIWWSIKAALNANHSKRVIVSTDDDEIAQVAREMGAEVPFMRPAKLAEDDVSSVASAVHAARWLEKHEAYQPDFVMLLQPTSPLRTEADIAGAIDLAHQVDAHAVVSVTPVEHHPYWMKKVDAAGRMRDFIDMERFIDNRQDLPDLYALNGAIYLVRRTVLLENESYHCDNTYAYVMPAERSLDIDTRWDLYLADLVLRDQNRVGPD